MKGFVNPYNFIRFPKEKAVAYGDEDRHTGVIKYTITTKTPLFIPNSSSDCAFEESDKVKEHKSYDFFSYTELDPGKRYEHECHVPVIPGSEMRGVVRNVYETLTDSCMGLLNAEEYPVKRSMERFKPALIYKDKNGRFSLYSAKSFMIGEASKDGKPLKEFLNDCNGTVIHYQEPHKINNYVSNPIQKYSRQPGKYQEQGYLLKWRMGLPGVNRTKTRYHVYTAERPIKDIHLSRDVIENKLVRLIDSYMSEPTAKSEDIIAYKEYEEDLFNFLKSKEEAYFPVNYSELKKSILYLSPATYTKEVSDNNLGKLAGKFAPCDGEYCPACDLFGYVGKNNESCKGSKIRFTDMYVTEEDKDASSYYAKDKVTIQALGEPKLGNTEFYLKKPQGATFWTYDYYVQKRNDKYEPVVSGGELRGRKYYWHHRKVDLGQEVEVTKLNKTIRPVRENVGFHGQLFFEGISEKQLKQLIWILNSGSEGLGLKLGGAKPLGYGSVSCKVDEVVERRIEVSDGTLAYEMTQIPVDTISYEEAGLSKTVKDEFYKIAGLESVPEDVEITYPKDQGQKNKPLTEGYRWFVNNHTTHDGRMARGRADVEIIDILPEILKEDFTLPYNEKPKKNSKGSNYNGKNNHGGRNTFHQKGKNWRK